MHRTLALLLLASALVAGCAYQPASGTAGGRPCDDGGEGGVLIDGVCL